MTVQPQGEAAKGGYATVNFKVPNERDGASTVKLEVTLDRDHPLASVMPQPVPGWTVKVEKTRLATPLDLHGKKITEAPSKITWTASGSKIEPGQFQQFPVSLGRLPENTDRLVFKALQTYDNKEVVRWIEEPRGTEPDSPRPSSNSPPPRTARRAARRTVRRRPRRPPPTRATPPPGSSAPSASWSEPWASPTAPWPAAVPPEPRRPPLPM